MQALLKHFSSTTRSSNNLVRTFGTPDPRSDQRSTSQTAICYLVIKLVLVQRLERSCRGEFFDLYRQICSFQLILADVALFFTVQPFKQSLSLRLPHSSSRLSQNRSMLACLSLNACLFRFLTRFPTLFAQGNVSLDTSRLKLHDARNVPAASLSLSFSSWSSLTAPKNPPGGTPT